MGLFETHVFRHNHHHLGFVKHLSVSQSVNQSVSQSVSLESLYELLIVQNGS